MNKKDFSLKTIGPNDIRIIYDWRNSDRVRFNMFESEIIPFENHLKWCEGLKNNTRSKCVMFQWKGENIGVITAKELDSNINKWIWGCYLGDGNYFQGAEKLRLNLPVSFCRI